MTRYFFGIILATFIWTKDLCAQTPGNLINTKVNRCGLNMVSLDPVNNPNQSYVSLNAGGLDLEYRYVMNDPLSVEKAKAILALMLTAKSQDLECLVQYINYSGLYIITYFEIGHR